MNEHVNPETMPEDVKIPEGKSLGEWIESRVARYKTRTLDWNALKFQADYDPKYKRAQMRYLGTGATGVAKDDNVVPAEHFTFSTMVLPAGVYRGLVNEGREEALMCVMIGSLKPETPSYPDYHPLSKVKRPKL